MTPDPIDALLKGPAKYIDDAGFTQRVMGALPPRKAPSRARGFVLGGAALAALLVLGLGPLRLGADAPYAWPLVLGAAVFFVTALSMVLRETEAAHR